MYSKGISWIDDVRIPFVDETILLKGYEGDKWATGEIKKSRVEDKINTQGRFPANILVSDDMLNDGNIGQNNSKNQEWKLQYKSESHIYGKYKGAGISRIADKGSNSRYYDIDKWFNNLIDG
jgi:hypothetical protein